MQPSWQSSERGGMKDVCRKVRELSLVLMVAAAAVICGAVLYGIRADVVVSGSMEPGIMTGSLCFTNQRDRDIRCGDIIAYRLGDMTVIHRVVDITDEGYITKGDNNDDRDNMPVTDGQIVGKNIGSIRNAGYLVCFLKSRTGAAVVLCLFMLLWVVSHALKKRDL